jgi:hypothetical protein
VAVAADGSALSYRPEPGYCNTQSGEAPDTFRYTLSGGSAATVAVTVTCAGNLEPAPAPTARLELGHPSTRTNGRSTVIVLRCLGQADASCAGSVRLRPTHLRDRLQASAARHAVRFKLAAGDEKRVRLKLPAVTRNQLARRRKAVVRAVARLDDGKAVKRLVTVYAHDVRS